MPGALIGFIFASPILMASLGLSGTMASGAKLQAGFPFQGNIPGQATIAGSIGSGPPFTVDFTSISALPSQISFSRASNAMLYDGTGKLTYAPNNLLLYSNDFTNAAWAGSNFTKTAGVADPFGGTSATTLTDTAGGGYINAGGATNAATCIGSVWLRRRTGTGIVRMWNPGAVNQDITASLTSSWQRFGFVSAPTPGVAYIQVQTLTAGDAIDIYGAQLEAVTYETSPRTYNPTTSSSYYGPRFDHDPVTLAAKGLLAEEQRTNLILQSNNFADTGSPLWAYQTSTGVQNVTGPDGVSNGAWTVTASSTFAQFYQPISLSAGSVYSVYVKKGTSPYVYIQTNFSTGGLVKLTYFDPATGAVVNANVTDTGSGSGVQTAITSTPVGNGWYRIGVINTGDSTAYVAFGLAATSSSHATTIGHTAFFFGAQVEAAAFPTSYIPTTSAAVTRSADFNSIAGADFTSVYNQSANTFVLEYQGEETPDPFGDIFSINNGSFQETNTIYADLAIFFRAGNVNQLTPGPALSTPLAAGSPHRVAVAASVAGGYAICCDGSTDNTGFNTATVGAMPTPDRIEFGGFSRVSGNKPSGWYRSLSIYKSRLSDAQLQSLTSFDPVFTTDFTSISALPSQVSFSRASNAMVYDDNGMLTYAPNNLFFPSDDFTSTNWAKVGTAAAPGANTLNFPASGDRVQAFVMSSGIVGKTAIFSVVLSGSGTTTLGIYDGVTLSGVQVLVTLTATPTRYYYRASVPTGSAADVRLWLGRVLGTETATSVTASGVTLSAVTYETTPRAVDQVVTTSAAYFGPRFDYDPFTYAAKGLLIEEQRTNEALYSNTFDNAAWVGAGKTVTAAAGTSPDGTTNAYRLQLTANPQGASYIQQVIAGAAGSSQTHTFSIWARATSGTQAFAIKFTQGAVADHFSADLIATTTWQRFTFIQAFAAGGSAPIVGITTPIGGTAVDIQIFGAQFERNVSFPTSYIPATSAAVTRSADVAQLAGSALTTVQGGSGTQVSEIDSVDPGSPNILSGLAMQLATGTTPTVWQTFPGSSLTVSGANDRTLGPVRAATSWGSNGASLHATGVAAVATGTVPEPSHVTPASLAWYLGCRNDGAGNFLNGHFRNFTLYNVRLPDSRLQSVTALSLTDGVATLPVVTPNVSVPVINGSTFNVTAGSASSLDAQLFAAAGADGDLNHEVVIPTGTPIDGNFTLYNKHGANPRGKGWILVRSNGTLPAPGVRALPTDASQMAKITCTPTGSGQRIFATESSAHHYYLCGLEITPNQGSIKLSGLINLGTPAVDQSFIEPHHIVIDRSYIHGLTTGNCTRIGISLQSRYTAIINNTIGPFVDTDPTVEAKSMYAVNGTGGYLISNNDIYASGQSFLVGGGDPLTAGKNPSDITITRNKFRKDPAWYGAGFAVKNHVEFKIGKRVLIEGNKFQYNWSEPVGGNTQNGQALSIQTKNQDGTATWNETSNVCVRYNDFQDVTQLVSLSARSPTNYGVALHNVEFHDNRAYNIGLFSGHSGAGFAGIVVTAGPSNADSINSLAFRRNTILINDPSVFSFNMDNSSQPSTGQNTNFIFDDNIFTIATLGFKDTSASEGSPSIARFWTTTDVRGNVWIGSLHGATYPASNTTAANEAAMNFNADKSLGVGSPGLTSSISGGLSGANIAGVGGVNDKVLGV